MNATPLHRRRWLAALLAALLAAFIVTAPVASAQQSESDNTQPPTPDEARDAACDVIGCEPNTLPEPPDLPNFQIPPVGAASGIGSVILVILIIVVVAALVLAIVAMARNRRSDDEEDEDNRDHIDVTTGIHGRKRRAPKTAKDWEELALLAAGEDDYEAALRYLHHAGVLRLDEDGHIRFQKGRTNGEYAALLAAARPSATSKLRNLNRGVEDVLFGERPATAERFSDAERGWSELRNELTPSRDRG